MGIQTFFRNLFPHRNTITRKPSTKRKLKPRIELLEDRTVPAFTATLSGTTVTFTESAITNGNDLLIFSDDGSGFLQHNRFDEGDVGFNSAIDLDSSIPGDQTIEVANLTELTVDAGNLADTVTLNVDLGTDTVDFGVAGTTDNGGVVNLNGTITNTVMGDAAIVNVGSTGSIQNGIDVVVENATVNVAAGNFDEVVTIATNGITLSGSGSDTTTVTTSIPADVITITADDVTVSNLQVTEGTNGISADSITNLTISGILSDLNDDHGLSVSSLTGMLMISSSVFQNNDNDSDIDGAGIHLDTVEIADISGSTSTGNEEALIASSLTTLTLSDNTFTVNNNDTAIDSLTTLNLNTTNGTVVDTVELNTPAIGGDGFLQHDRNGTIQDLVAYTLVTNLNIDVGDGNDSVTVNPHSTTLISLDGGEPTTFPGDVFSLDSTGTTGANLSVTNGNGIFSFTSGEANIQYTDFELIDSDNPYSLQINTGITDDDIQVTLVSGNLEVSRNGANIFRGDPSDISSLTINGEDGNDSLTVNVPTGIIPDLPEITYNGGSDTDSLFFLGGDNLNPITQETYLVGTNEDEGTWILDQDGNRGKGAAGAGNGDEIVVSFTGLEPADSDIPATNFDIIMNGSDNIATIENGGDLNGSTSLQLTDENATFETTRFANKVNVDIMGQSGEDAFVLDYTTNADGLLTLDIYGHVAPGTGFQPADDNAEDYFQPGATASGAIVGLFGQGGDDLFENMSLGFNMGISVPVGPFNLSSLNGEVSIDGGTAGETLGDNLALSDALSTGPDTVTITNNAISGAAPTTINYSNSDRVFFESTLADDILNIVGIDSISLELNLLDGDDSVTVNSTGGANVAELLVEGGAGTEDQITWDAGATTIGAVNFNEVELAFLDDDINTLSLDGNVTLITALDDQAMIQDGIDIAGGDAVGGSTFTLGDGVGSDLFQEENIEVNVNNLVIQGSGSLPENTEVTSNGMSNGFSIIANDITIENIRFRNNDNGIQATGVNNLSISNVETLDNDLDGINIVGSTLLPLVNIISTGNNGSGLCIDANDQPVTIQGGQYVDNDLDGIKITNAGDVTIATNVQANMNGRHGININDAGAVLIEINIQANNNGMLTVGDGIHVELLSGSITIRNGIQARTNSGSGICIDANDQPVTIQGGEYELNEIDGIKITNAGEVNINTNVQVNTNGRHGMNITDSNSVVIQNNIQVSGNGTMTPGDGVHIDTITGTTQFISGSDTFTVGVVITNNVDPTLNSLNGLNILNVPADTLIFNSIDSAGNSANGLAIQDTGNFLINTSTFNNNLEDGIHLVRPLSALLTEVLSIGNTDDGLEVQGDSSITTGGSTVTLGGSLDDNVNDPYVANMNDQGLNINNIGRLIMNRPSILNNTAGGLTPGGILNQIGRIDINGHGTATDINSDDSVSVNAGFLSMQFGSVKQDDFNLGTFDSVVINLGFFGEPSGPDSLFNPGTLFANTSSDFVHLTNGQALQIAAELGYLSKIFIPIGLTSDSTIAPSTSEVAKFLEEFVNSFVPETDLLANSEFILTNTLSDLADQYGFRPANSFFLNLFGYGEKWFQDRESNWFAITADGTIFEHTNFAGVLGKEIAKTSTSVYVNPNLLFDGAVLVDVLPRPTPILAAINDQTIRHSKPLDVTLFGAGGFSDELTYSAEIEGYDVLYEIDEAKQFRMNQAYYANSWNLNEKWIWSDTDATWFALLPDGKLYPYSNGLLGEMIADVGSDVWEDPTLLHEAPKPVAPVIDTIITDNNLTLDTVHIAPTTFRVNVSVSDGYSSATQSFLVTTTNSAPEFAEILANINTSHNSGPVSVDLQATDSDGDALTYNVEIREHNPLADWNERLDLVQVNGSYYYNSHGYNEKWLYSNAREQWFLLTDTGDLHPWVERYADEAVGSFGREVWVNPELLHEAVPSEILEGAAEVLGETVNIMPPEDFVGELEVTVIVSDSYASNQQKFLVNVTNEPPQILASLSTVTFSHSDFIQSIDLGVLDNDGDFLTYDVEIVEHNQAAILNQELQLKKVNGTYYENLYGMNEKWMQSTIDQLWYALLPNGKLYRSNGIYLEEQPVADLGIEYWVDPSLLHDASNSAPSHTIHGSIVDGILTLDWGEDDRGTFHITVNAYDGFETTTLRFLLIID